MPSKSRRVCTWNERRLWAPEQTEAVVTEPLEKIDLVDIVSERVDRDAEMVSMIVDAFLDDV
jgi:hypothetical protein